MKVHHILMRFFHFVLVVLLAVPWPATVSAQETSPVAVAQEETDSSPSVPSIDVIDADDADVSVGQPVPGKGSEAKEEPKTQPEASPAPDNREGVREETLEQMLIEELTSGQEAAAEEPKPAPAPKPEPKPAPKPAPKPEPKPAPKPAPEPEPAPEPAPAAEPEATESAPAEEPEMAEPPATESATVTEPEAASVGEEAVSEDGEELVETPAEPVTFQGALERLQSVMQTQNDALVKMMQVLEPSAQGPTARAADSLRGMKNVLEFGAMGDGETDDTAAFQQALDAVSAEGGGVVSVPTGAYRIATHLDIPAGVTLEGIWRAPQRGEPWNQGSVLLAVEGQGDERAVPFIRMHQQSTLAGLTIYYPEQIRANPPHPYPWTVQAQAGSDNVSILNVTMINPYKAVDFGTFGAGRHYINGLYGYPLKLGLYINQVYDVGRIENIHFWPFWDLDPKSPLWEFTKGNATAFLIGRTDGQMASGLFSIFYKTGMHFVAGDIIENGQIVRQSPGSGVYTNCYMDITSNAVKVDEVMAGSGISFMNSMMMSGVEVGRNNRGPVKFTGCGFWPNDGQTFHAQVAGEGTVMFESCHFSGWDQNRDGTPAIDSNAARIIISGNEFSTVNEESVKIALGPETRAAVVTSNLMSGQVGIENQASEFADVQIGFNAADRRPGFVDEWLIVGPFPNAPLPEAEAGRPSRGGHTTDFLEAIGGEANARIFSDTTVAYTDPAGLEQTVMAEHMDAAEGHMVDLKARFVGGSQAAYAMTYIFSTEEQTARFRFGSNDSAKVWVNGVQAHSIWTDQGRKAEPGTDAFTADLIKGVNPVLVKVEDAGGSQWGFVLEVYGENGQSLHTATNPPQEFLPPVEEEEVAIAPDTATDESGGAVEDTVVDTAKESVTEAPAASIPEPETPAAE